MLLVSKLRYRTSRCQQRTLEGIPSSKSQRSRRSIRCTTIISVSGNMWTASSALMYCPHPTFGRISIPVRSAFSPCGRPRSIRRIAAAAQIASNQDSMQYRSEQAPESAFDPEENWESALGYITRQALLAICMFISRCFVLHAVVTSVPIQSFADVDDPEQGF